MIKDNGYRTLTKIIKAVLKLNPDEHSVSYTVEVNCCGNLQIYRLVWNESKTKVDEIEKIYEKKLNSNSFSNSELESIYLQIIDDINSIIPTGGED